MNPDQATERRHPDQDSTKREQESEGKAHECSVRYDCMVAKTVVFLHDAAFFLLRADYDCYKRSTNTNDWLVLRCTEAKNQEQS